MPTPTQVNNASSNREKKKAAKQATKRGEIEKKPSDRPVIYDKIEVRICSGDEAVTQEQAKQLLGWTELPEDAKDYDLEISALFGKKIRCRNNPRNRPFDKTNCLKIVQEILKRRWRLNLATIVIGKTGLTISAQHRLVALILACQQWEQDKEKWSLWESEPTIETLLAFGCEEDDETANTHDSGKSRSLSDVLYLSSHFADVAPKDRKPLARILSYAVTMLWYRTGVENAFGLRQTPSEMLDFLDRHSKLMDCVKHIYEENEGGKIGQLVSPGYAAGLLYLMGCSASDPTKYNGLEIRHEKVLDWSRWDEAQTFWVNVAAGSKDLALLRQALSKLLDQGGGSLDERCTLVTQSWNLITQGKQLTEEGLRLDYVRDEGEVRRLLDPPSLGGIDLGIPRYQEEEDPEDDVVEPDEELTEAEMEARKSEVRDSKEAKKEKGRMPKDGDEVWVCPTKKGDLPWKGRLTKTRVAPGGTTIATVLFNNGKKDVPHDVAYERLSLTKPKEVA